MKKIFSTISSIVMFCVLAAGLFLTGCGENGVREIMNVSYDPTREFYEDYNQKFVEHWAASNNGEKISVDQSNGGSGSQAKKVAEGLEADVVTLALGYDIDLIGESIPGALSENWVNNFENSSCPYVSTIVFLVKKGNPKNLKDWNDLAQPGIAVITPNPRTSGGARWNYLAAWGWQLKQELGTLDSVFLKDPANAEKVKAANEKAYDLVKKIHLNAKQTGMPEGARSATNLFVRDGEGDVLLAWENEALKAVYGDNNPNFEIVYPTVSIIAEPSVAVINTTVERKQTRDIAEEYLKFMYTPEIQRLIMEHYYRPCDNALLEEKKDIFKSLELFRFADVFGTWSEVQKEHFSNGGVFEKMMEE